MELIDAGNAADALDATMKAFLAGVDMSMQSHFYMDHLPDLVAKGEVPIALVDASVRRVLELKARLGLFDNPYRRIHPGREEQRVRKIGRASCRERVCQYVSISGVAVSLKKNNTITRTTREHEAKRIDNKPQT